MAGYNEGSGSYRNANQTLFRKVAQSEIQDTGKLAETVQRELGVQGGEYVFPWSGKLTLGELTGIPGTDGELIEANIKAPKASLTEWAVGVYSRLNWNAKQGFSANDMLVRELGKAMGRRRDQVIIDRINTEYSKTDRGGIAQVTNSDIGSGNDRLWKAATLAREKLMDEGADYGDCCFVIRSDIHSAFMQTDHVISKDYTSADTAQTARYGMVQGFKVVPIAKNRDEGGMPASRIFAYHRDAIGLAENLGDIEVLRAPGKFGWIVEATLNAGAAIIDPNGIVGVELA